MAVDRDVRASPRHLLEVSLDDRRALDDRQLDEVAGHGAPAAQGRPAAGGAHVPDPVAFPTEHRHEVPAALPVGHPDWETADPSRATTHSLENRRATASPRPPAYIARSFSSVNGQLAIARLLLA
jgi:hypothetical protein